jgi:hypothetical protein
VRRHPGRAVALILLLVATVVGLQAALERREPLPASGLGGVLYMRSPALVARAALSYRTLLADVYWLRAVQYFGRTKLSTDPRKQYDLLYPLLDLTTSLDPRFNVAYRFGAIFLAEPSPGGPGRPDLAIELLEKGLRSQPNRWELAEDIGFVWYWWFDDHERAASWFTRASRMPDAPEWLAPIAAVTLAQGGNRDSSRQLWREIARTAEADWLRGTATLRLSQLDAMDQLDQLRMVADRYQERTGRESFTWYDVIDEGLIPGVPVDPAGSAYVFSEQGLVTLNPRSALNPLPDRGRTP